MFKDVITLIDTISIVNDIGDPIKTPIKKENIFANKKSIRQSEFYQASAIGLKPEITFEIRSCEYNYEPTLEYKLKPYTIIRTYERDDDFIELTCQGVVNNATT